MLVVISECKFMKLLIKHSFKLLRDNNSPKILFFVILKKKGGRKKYCKTYSSI